MRLVLCVLGGATLLAACLSKGPATESSAPRIDGLGQSNWAITTKSKEAQRLFTQGLLLNYAFDHDEAARSFEAGLAADSACAMCAWGAAQALGPNINQVSGVDQEQAARYQALAVSLAGGVSALERALIQTAEHRYDREGAQASKAAGEPVAPVCSGNGQQATLQDRMYAQLIARVYAQYPAQLDVAVLFAEAHLLLQPQPWWGDDGKGKASPALNKAIEALQAVIQAQPAHTGANHLLVHAFDYSPYSAQALGAAQRLHTLAPGAPHLLHMPSHIYIRTGQYAEAAEANQAALRADSAREEVVKAQGFKPTSSWRGHHQQFLQYSAMMDGDSQVALQTSRMIKDKTRPSASVHAQYFRSYLILNQLRFQQWQDVLATAVPEQRGGLEEGIWLYAQARAQHALARVQQAAAPLSELRRLADLPANAGIKIFDEQPLLDVFKLLIDVLEGEQALAQGRVQEGIASLERAALAEDALKIQDPPMLGAHARVLLGQRLLDRKQFARAESTAREELQRNPGSGWALVVLADALQAQSKLAEMNQILGQLGDRKKNFSF